MRIVRLLIPGQFEDAFIYMGRVVALTTERTIQLFDLDRIAASISSRYEGVDPIGTLMFSRNDWINGQVLEALVRNEGIASSLMSAFDRFPQPYVEIQAQDSSPTELDLNIQADALLDLNIYNGRIYIAADTGLYDLDLDWKDSDSMLSLEPRRRTDARCISTSVGFGSVNASCGSAGLLSSFDDFGWTTRRNGGLHRIADESIRSGWLHFDLINYASQIQAVLLKSEQQRGEGHPQMEDERRIVTAIGNERFDLNYLFEEIRTRFSVEKESIQYTYNSRSVIFIHTIDGHFYSLGIKTPKQGPPQTAFGRTYKGAQTRVLSVNSTAVGLVIETDHRVLAFSNNEWHPILESDVISVRTFIRSRRYRNMVALTTEQGLIIAGLYQEPDLQVVTAF